MDRARTRGCVVCKIDLPIVCFTPRVKACLNCEGAYRRKKADDINEYHRVQRKKDPERFKAYDKKYKAAQVTRLCIVCGVSKDIAHFSGIKRHCVECDAEFARRKKESGRIKSLTTYHKNKEKYKENNLLKREVTAQKACPKCHNIFPSTEFISSIGNKRAYCKTCINSYKRAQYEVDPELQRRIKEKYKEYRQDNLGKVTSYQKWYRTEHLDAALAHNRKRRAIQKNAVVTPFDEESHQVSLYRWQQGRCFYCGDTLRGWGTRPRSHIHLEHIVPLARQGTHSPENLVLACPSCNLQKRAQLYSVEWTPRKQILDIPLFLEDKEIPKNAYVISTFAAIRSREPDFSLENLKLEHPEGAFFFDYEWWSKKSIIQSMMAVRNGELTSHLSASKTTVVDVDVSQARIFFEKTHVQGFGQGTVFLGLIDRENNLVALSSWLVFREHIELNRFSSSVQVVGGFSKLVTAFARSTYNTGAPIISFVDLRYATGGSYPIAGFKELGMTASPTLYYVNGTGIFHRRRFQKQHLKANLSYFDPNLTEWRNALINGYSRLWGAHQKKFIWLPK